MNLQEIRLQCFCCLQAKFFHASLMERTSHAFILGQNTTNAPLMFSKPILFWDLPGFICLKHCSASEMFPLNPVMN